MKKVHQSINDVQNFFITSSRKFLHGNALIYTVLFSLLEYVSLSLFVVVCFALFDLLCVPSFSHSNRPSRAATTFLFTNCVALSVYERLLNGTVGKEIRRRSKFDIFLLLLFLMLLLVFFCC